MYKPTLLLALFTTVWAAPTSKPEDAPTSKPEEAPAKNDDDTLEQKGLFGGCGGGLFGGGYCGPRTVIMNNNPMGFGGMGYPGGMGFRGMGYPGGMGYYYWGDMW